MKCENCNHSLAVLENKSLNFFYIGCKKCGFYLSKSLLPNQEWFKTKAEASHYKKCVLTGRKRILN